MHQITSGSHFLEGLPNGIYDVLAELPSGLLLDVGASAGPMTRLMLQASPQSRVIAFEPFPGNFPHFERTIGSDQRVTLVKAAVGAKGPTGRLLVERVVSGSESGWEKFSGASSEGFLLTPGDQRDGVPVEVVRIDDMIGGEHVRFMKIDVQGGELGVLRSAEKAIAEARIDLMFIEFTGDQTLLQHLIDRQLHLFDAEWVLVPRKRRRKKLSWRALVYGRPIRLADLSNWDIVSEARASNGARLLRAWPRSAPSTPAELCRLFERERDTLYGLWTDIIAVAPHFIEQFKLAATAAMARRRH